jgi:hypothetical protein
MLREKYTIWEFYTFSGQYINALRILSNIDNGSYDLIKNDKSMMCIMCKSMTCIYEYIID